MSSLVPRERNGLLQVVDLRVQRALSVDNVFALLGIRATTNQVLRRGQRTASQIGQIARASE